MCRFCQEDGRLPQKAVVQERIQRAMEKYKSQCDALAKKKKIKL